MNDKSFNLDFTYAYGLPQVSAIFRQRVEDFQVTEIFEEPFTDEGEHFCFWIEKRGENTRWVAKLLAEFFHVSEAAVGFCGLKDRHAIAKQWFSVHLPGKSQIEVPVLNENISVLKQVKHSKKIRRGDHSANHFVIRLRNCRSLSNDNDNVVLDINERINAICEKGVPNYFGEQRFGHDGNNLREAEQMLNQLVLRQQQPVTNTKRRGRRNNKRSALSGIYLSAARSYIFNQVLSQRMATEGWTTLIAKGASETGPLWGRGRSQASAKTEQLESALLQPWSDWLTALEFTGLSQERRVLQLVAQNVEYRWEDEDIVLSFVLGKGEYATSFLREIMLLDSPQKTPVI